MISFGYDPAFYDFNFCESWDPALRSGPDSASLYRLVYTARQGDRFAPSELAETMEWTLRPATWEFFQRVHGHRPASHTDWFYAKLTQFVEVLTYAQLTVLEKNRPPRKLKPDDPLRPDLLIIGHDGPYVQPEELEEAVVAERHAEYPWHGLVRRTLEQPADRAGAAQAWLREQRMALSTVRITQPRGGWIKNRERDQIILNCLNRGWDQDAICEELDKRTIPTPPSLQGNNHQRWTDGWRDPQTRNAIQQLFSKVRTRRSAVKPLAISK